MLRMIFFALCTMMVRINRAITMHGAHVAKAFVGTRDKLEDMDVSLELSASLKGLTRDF